MMCLGWNNQETCKTRGADQLVSPSGVQPGPNGGTNAAGCPDISWFWIGVAALVGGAVIGKK